MLNWDEIEVGQRIRCILPESDSERFFKLFNLTFVVKKKKEEDLMTNRSKVLYTEYGKDKGIALKIFEEDYKKWEVCDE